MKLKFSVLGEPAGKGRPRFRNAGAFVQPYTPEKTVSYENLVRLEYRRQCNDFKFPKDTPLDVRITAYYGIPKSASKKKAQLMRERKIRPMKKPDFDNIGKIVCDSLNDIAYQKFSDIRNVGAAIHSMIESVTEKMDEVGFKDDEEWTYLTKIFGSNAIPAESAATITKAIKKAEKDGAITSKNRWQLIEMLATEYLAGK